MRLRLELRLMTWEMVLFDDVFKQHKNLPLLNHVKDISSPKREPFLPGVILVNTTIRDEAFPIFLKTRPRLQTVK